MRGLIITEKHSVAKRFAQVLGLRDSSGVTSGKGGATGFLAGTRDGDEWVVTWCFGHMVETAMPDAYDARYKRWTLEDLPIIPERWRYRASGHAAARRQLSVVKGLIRDGGFDVLYHAADCDREGELIVREVLRETRGVPRGMELRRVWYGSVTDEAILRALREARPLSDYDGLGDAADARQKLDWLYGINLTRAYTVHCGDTRNVGRVVSPTINLVVRRQDEIDGFVPRRYADVAATMRYEDGRTFVAHAKLEDVEAGRRLAEALAGRPATVASVESKRASKRVWLYDLTEMQQVASKLYGMEPSETMAAMQALYEAGLATYPRTSSNCITPDDAAEVAALLPDAAALFGPVPAPDMDVSRIVVEPRGDDKEASHTGLCPTAPGLASLTAGRVPNGRHEADLLRLVAARLAEACMPPHVTETTSVRLDAGDVELSASGTVVVDEGYRPFAEAAHAAMGIRGRGRERDELPPVAAGETWMVESAVERDKETKPPKPYTTATLLATMKGIARLLPEKDMRDVMRAQGAGLGTSSSRDQVIATMKRGGFVTTGRDGSLRPTDKARELMAILPDEVKEPSMTARMEARLTLVAEGRESEEDLLRDVERVVRADVDAVRAMPRLPRRFAPADAKVVVPHGCPFCDGDMVETKKAYTCSSCGFPIWKETASKRVGKRDCVALCRDGMLPEPVSGLKRRDGTPFRGACWLYVDPRDRKVRFDFSEGGDVARTANARAVRAREGGSGSGDAGDDKGGGPE